MQQVISLITNLELNGFLILLSLMISTIKLITYNVLCLKIFFFNWLEVTLKFKLPVQILYIRLQLSWLP